MYKTINFINRKNGTVQFSFFTILQQNQYKFLGQVYIWAHDRMIWELPERLQLIGGIPVYQLRLERELVC